jgi:hypothetical protein
MSGGELSLFITQHSSLIVLRKVIDGNTNS